MAAFCLAVLTVPAAVQSAPAPVERSGLDQVPATAPIVVHVRGAQGTRDRLVAMMEKALPDVLAKFQPQMDDALKNGVQGRKLRGLAKDGPIFLVFTELPKPNENPPKMAIILAVTDYKAFRDGLLTEEEQKNVKENNGVESATIDRETVYFVDRKGYAVVTPNEEVATAFTKKQAGLNGKLSKEQAGKLMNSDVGVYIAVDALNKEYAEQIKQARQGIEQAIDFGAAQAPDKAQKNAIEMAKGAIGPIFQAIEDSQGVLLTAEFRPGGLAFHIQSEVREGSPTGQLLQDTRPVTFQELARMPEGRAYYMGMKTSSALLKGLGNFVAAASKDNKEGKAMSEAMDELAKAKPEVRLDAFSFPPAGLQVHHYQDPAKAVAAELKLFKSMEAGGTVSTGTLKEKPVIKESAQKHGDFQLHSVQFVWDFDKMAEPFAQKGEEAKKQFIEGMKGLMGEKMTIWFGTDGKSVVQVSAPDWETAQKLLDQYVKGNNTAGNVAAFTEVRKEMPAEASFLALVDAVQSLGAVVEGFKPLLGGIVPPNWPAIPGKGTPSFVGVSVTLQPQRGGFDFFLSNAAAQEIYKAFVKPLLPQ
jgi:hypothetical protein